MMQGRWELACPAEHAGETHDRADVRAYTVQHAREIVLVCRTCEGRLAVARKIDCGAATAA